MRTGSPPVLIFYNVHIGFAQQRDKLEFVLLIIGYHILPTQTLERHYPNNDMTTRLVF